MPRAKKWRWVRLDVVLAVHERQLAEHGGATGLLDIGRVEAALDRPRNLAAYKTPDAADLAAAYATGLAKNHPFTDGNKRVAWVAARLFLADNGFKLQFDPTEAVRVMERVAAGSMKEVQLAKWLRNRIIDSGK